MSKKLKPALKDVILLHSAGTEMHQRAITAALKDKWFIITDPKEYFHGRFCRPAYGGCCATAYLMRKEVVLRMDVARKDETGFVDGYTHKDDYYCLNIDQLTEISPDKVPDVLRRL